MTIPIFIPYFFILFYCPGIPFHTETVVGGRGASNLAFNWDTRGMSPFSIILATDLVYFFYQAKVDDFYS